MELVALKTALLKWISKSEKAIERNCERRSAKSLEPDHILWRECAASAAYQGRRRRSASFERMFFLQFMECPAHLRFEMFATID
jgi:hypothetical protein